MLIFPSLAIQEKLCSKTPVGEQGTTGKYPRNPVAVARMWRSENAKAIHVVDIDGLREGKICNQQVLRELSCAVDIPIQLSSGFRTYEDVQLALEDLGMFRVVLETPALTDPEMITTLIQEYGPRKVVLSLEVTQGKVYMNDGQKTQEYSPVEAGNYVKTLGIQRVVYHRDDMRTIPAETVYNDLHEFAKSTGLSVTVRGMVQNYTDLKMLQTLYPRKIDSLILGEPLYINAFPCQRIWRIAEKELIKQHRFF